MLHFLTQLVERKTRKRYEEIVALVATFEEGMRRKTPEELRAASDKLRERIRGGESEDQVLPEAFALVREASVRTLGKRHFDTQIIGGATLHEGKIAEMLTGEGKTLAATLPAYLNALSGKGVHVVTVNEYLAKRDTVWMGQIYHALGLSVSCLVHEGALMYDPEYTKSKFQNLDNTSHAHRHSEVLNGGQEDLDKKRDLFGGFMVFSEFLRPVARKEAYAADITYGTNHEFGFDYLRDNLVLRLADRVQRGHHYAIIDEVDSILIDEARTPLIIAAPDQTSSEYYRTFARIVEGLQEERDYVKDEKLKTANLTEEGISRVERAIGVGNLFDPEHGRLVHFLQESLKAKTLFERDRDYVVRDGEVIIVDQFTGRMLHGRRYSGGLHQAIEAKEGVFVREESRTYAQITIQNYFRMYEKLSGMTGTAQTSAEEFHKVYNLEVVSVPPNRPMVRNDLPDRIYKTKEAKYRAVAAEVKERHERGQPVLIGTTSITNNETVSAYLSRAGIPHEVLNAKNNEREGLIIAQAGKLGAVTVATNMAGRGVDIILGGNPPAEEDAKKVLALGGLHVLGTERHEARRIDNQLRGRAGRQGDPGSTQFFLSLEDDLVRIFGGDRIARLMESVHFPEDTPIESGIVSKAVNQAQQKVEGANFDVRKHLLDFDDVLNKQREVMYRKREQILRDGENGEILRVVRDIVRRVVEQAKERLLNMTEEERPEAEREKEIAALDERFAKLPETIEPERSVIIGQHLVRIIDTLWIEHLENLEALRDSVNIRAYGQREPLVEYRREGLALFQALNANFEALVFHTIFPLFEMKLEQMRPAASGPTNGAPAGNTPQHAKHIGRNDPCWCGAKKPDGTPIKYKHCHGA